MTWLGAMGDEPAIGGHEALRDDAVRMAERLRAMGCEVALIWPGGGVSGDGVPPGWPICTKIRAHPADTMRSASTVRSGDLTGFLGVTVTPLIRSDLGRHLLGEFRELLGLRGHRLELLACMRGRQLYEL